MPASHYASQSLLNKIVLILRRGCGVIFERHRAGGDHQHQWAGSRAVHPFDPWSWLFLRRAQACGVDCRRACHATEDISALAGES